MDQIYAIGDIHGCHEKLEALLVKIEAHAGRKPYRAIFLGDYVDRGLDSRAVVNRVRDLLNGRDAGNGTWHALRGNHEELMLDAVVHRRSIGLWEDNGGDATIRSYRGYASEMRDDAEWLATLPTMIETENHVFVHAGCNPRYALSEQPDEVLLWTRNWERDDHDFGKHIVYGHNAKEDTVLRPFSSGLDTGACYGGPLTAGVFDASVRSGPIAILTAS